MTNDAIVRCKIESDSSDVVTQRDVAGDYVTNDTTVTKMTKSADSNTEVTRKGISEEDTKYAKSCVGMQLGCKGQKVLGLAWDYEEDTISLDLSAIARRAEGLPATKRNTLRLIAGIFDPLGIIGPVTITAKILFQEACRQKIGWDDPLKDKVKQDVETWIEGLLECRQITIRRCVYEHVQEEVLECSLHGFADASKKAYCAVIYLTYRAQTGRYSKMLTSKTRVAQLKELSIPRLELMAGMVLVKLMSTVKNALCSQVQVQQTKLWSDSMTALYWIMNRGEWKQFVRHRVNEILKSSSKSDWSYCPSEENPADIGSRELMAVELNGNELWWKGPAWLIEAENSWPTEKSIHPTNESKEEEKKTAVTVLATNANALRGVEYFIEIRKFSSIRKLFRVTAWIKRFCFNARKRHKSDRKSGTLSLEEIRESENEWIMAAQRELKQDSNYQQLVSKFGLREDRKGLVRCKGRLEYSDLESETREPIILPKKHDLTFL